MRFSHEIIKDFFYQETTMLAIEAASFTLRIGALFSTSEKNDIDFVTLDMGNLVMGVQGTRTVEPSPWIAHFSDLAILSLDSTSLAEWTRRRSAGTDLFTCSTIHFFCQNNLSSKVSTSETQSLNSCSVSCGPASMAPRHARLWLFFILPCAIPLKDSLQP